MNEPDLRSRVADLRDRVDSLDLRLLQTLADRAAVVRELSTHKHALGIPLCDPAREGEMEQMHASWADRLGLPQQFVRDLFAVVLQSSRDLQARLRDASAGEAGR